ncbi:uncharacterized protein LOC124882497 [Girardinichthys multiradiatus]|uniref:uncharacterized protein LOC124882497 n=1 Tax=Girardinichthys multiradiatus TaxID=208333 RepID=UPI001FABF412|nr:uncharacterized protein LOC124882497 [Girardinichthys multiradiatus]
MQTSRQRDAATGQHSSIFTVKVGDDVALPCEKETDDQNNCNKIVWISTNFLRTETVFDDGQILADTTESGRLSVVANCSLLIKNVTEVDVGRYTCRRLKSGQWNDFNAHLSVLTMTEQKNDDTITLFCSLLNYGKCRHNMEWLFEGKENIFLELETSSRSCSATVTFPTSQPDQNPKVFQCQLTNRYNKDIQLFNLRYQSSVEKTGENMM